MKIVGRAFEGCKNLDMVKFGAYLILTPFEDGYSDCGVFQDFINLEKIVFPDKLEEIKFIHFQAAQDLKQLQL